MAGSTREAEKSEKIIRGLLKLPENKRCINCGSVGPQYVCTNFNTFVCTTCSGVHREFSHRIKSISMSTFTKEEAAALQQGGNEKARQLVLKTWDFTRQTLPDNGDLHSLREFIRGVYLDKRFNGERPPPPIVPQAEKAQPQRTQAQSERPQPPGQGGRPQAPALRNSYGTVHGKYRNAPDNTKVEKKDVVGGGKADELLRVQAARGLTRGLPKQEKHDTPPLTRPISEILGEGVTITVIDPHANGGYADDAASRNTASANSETSPNIPRKLFPLQDGTADSSATPESARRPPESPFLIDFSEQVTSAPQPPAPASDPFAGTGLDSLTAPPGAPNVQAGAQDVAFASGSSWATFDAAPAGAPFYNSAPGGMPPGAGPFGPANTAGMWQPPAAPATGPWGAPPPMTAPAGNSWMQSLPMQPTGYGQAPQHHQFPAQPQPQPQSQPHSQQQQWAAFGGASVPTGPLSAPAPLASNAHFQPPPQGPNSIGYLSAPASPFNSINNTQVAPLSAPSSTHGLDATLPPAAPAPAPPAFAAAFPDVRSSSSAPSSGPAPVSAGSFNALPGLPSTSGISTGSYAVLDSPLAGAPSSTGSTATTGPPGSAGPVPPSRPPTSGAPPLGSAPGQVAPAPAASKPLPRPAIPEDLFSNPNPYGPPASLQYPQSTPYLAPLPLGGYGAPNPQYNAPQQPGQLQVTPLVTDVPGAMPAYAEPPKSLNPFDDEDPSPASAEAPSFANMDALGAALPGGYGAVPQAGMPLQPAAGNFSNPYAPPQPNQAPGNPYGGQAGYGAPPYGGPPSTGSTGGGYGPHSSGNMDPFSGGSGGPGAGGYAGYSAPPASGPPSSGSQGGVQPASEPAPPDPFAGLGFGFGSLPSKQTSHSSSAAANPFG